MAEQNPFHSSLLDSHGATKTLESCFIALSLIAPRAINNQQSFFSFLLFSVVKDSMIQGRLVWIYITRMCKKAYGCWRLMWACNELLLTTFDLIYMNVPEGFSRVSKMFFFFS